MTVDYQKYRTHILAYNRQYQKNGGKVTYSCKKCGIVFKNGRLAWAHKTVLGHKVSYE